MAFTAGLHRTYISGVERGVRNPTILVLDQIADALGTSASQLLLQGPPPPTLDIAAHPDKVGKP